MVEHRLAGNLTDLVKLNYLLHHLSQAYRKISLQLEFDTEGELTYHVGNLAHMLQNNI